MSTARTATRSGVVRNRSRAASRPAAGPPPGGSSTVQVTGRDVGTCSPTTTTSGADSVAASERSRSVTPSTSIEALSTPPMRAAVPPASTTAPRRSGSPAVVTAPVWQAGAVTALRLALVQHAASLDPAENRDALGDVAGKLEDDTGLVLLPEAF